MIKFKNGDVLSFGRVDNPSYFLITNYIDGDFFWIADGIYCPPMHPTRGYVGYSDCMKIMLHRVCTSGAPKLVRKRNIIDYVKRKYIEYQLTEIVEK